jgi:hypothetical protein
MRLLRIEMNRGRGWELRAEGKIPADVTTGWIRHEGYTVQYPHRALLDGVEVARAEAEVRLTARWTKHCSASRSRDDDRC